MSARSPRRGFPSVVCVRLAGADGRDAVLCERCALADTAPARLRGLMGATALEPGEGMLLRPAAAVHTLLMRFAIDVVFIDRRGRVVRAVEGLRPWRFASRRGAHAALELPAGAWRRAHGRVGDVVRYSPAL